MTETKNFFPEGWLYDSTENKKAMFSPTLLNEAMQREDILEATAKICDAEHNLIVDLGCMRGIIPRCEGAIGISEGKTRDIALISRVGKPVSFTVKNIKTDRLGRLYAELSRKNAQEKFLSWFFENKTPGSVVNAKVTHLENFGAFCDIGCGIIALLPIDAISVSRISHPKDRFSVGDDIRAVIKCIDENKKITLSMKELLGTWEENADLFSEGQTVSGIIRSVESYGVFVELTPNLAGLAEPRPDAFIGQTAGVYIKSILKEKMKVKLIIIDCFDGKQNTPLHYFSDTDYIDYWQYSPENCIKNIYTDFLHQ